MTKLYVKKIKAGEMTIEDVPPRWRPAVKSMLEAET